MMKATLAGEANGLDTLSRASAPAAVRPTAGRNYWN